MSVPSSFHTLASVDSIGTWTSTPVLPFRTYLRTYSDEETKAWLIVEDDRVANFTIEAARQGLEDLAELEADEMARSQAEIEQWLNETGRAKRLSEGWVRYLFSTQGVIAVVDPRFLALLGTDQQSAEKIAREVEASFLQWQQSQAEGLFSSQNSVITEVLKESERERLQEIFDEYNSVPHEAAFGK